MSPPAVLFFLFSGPLGDLFCLEPKFCHNLTQWMAQLSIILPLPNYTTRALSQHRESVKMCEFVKEMYIGMYTSDNHVANCEVVENCEVVNPSGLGSQTQETASPLWLLGLLSLCLQEWP